jgi:hypothetical protein
VLCLCVLVSVIDSSLLKTVFLYESLENSNMISKIVCNTKK